MNYHTSLDSTKFMLRNYTTADTGRNTEVVRLTTFGIAFSPEAHCGSVNGYAIRYTLYAAKTPVKWFLASTQLHRYRA
jgi:hypothetical protein